MVGHGRQFPPPPTFVPETCEYLKRMNFCEWLYLGTEYVCDCTVYSRGRSFMTFCWRFIDTEVLFDVPVSWIYDSSFWISEFCCLSQIQVKKHLEVDYLIMN